MIVGTGIDIAEVPRVAEAIERYGQRFLQRIFTEGEIRYCESKANRVERYAARFAAKEAGMKALGTGWNHGSCHPLRTECHAADRRCCVLAGSVTESWVAEVTRNITGKAPPCSGSNYVCYDSA